MLALGNMEYPAVPDAPLHPALEAMGRFRAEPVDADKTNANAAPALQLLSAPAGAEGNRDRDRLPLQRADR